MAAPLPSLRALDRLLAQAGLRPSGAEALLAIALCVALAYLMLRLAMPPAPALLLAATFGIGLPVFRLSRLRAWRRHRVEAQLPDALDLLAQSLRAGLPVNAAFAVVARQTPDPLGSELGVVVDQVTCGRALDDALEHLNERMDLPDLRQLAIAVAIQRGGSDLAATLDGIAGAACCAGPPESRSEET
jgi:tight adherence protein B